MYTNENKITQSQNKSGKNIPGKIPFFQPKLTINTPGDQYEQEADAMADKVMRMPMNDQSFFSPKPVSVSRLQRKCRECEEEENQIQKKPASEIIQRDSNETSGQKAIEDDPDINPFKLKTTFNPRLNYKPVTEELNFRGVPFIASYYDDSTAEFLRQYQFYKSLGLGKLAQKASTVPVLNLLIPDLPGNDPDAALANKTTSLSVGAALSRDYPLETERDTTNMHIFNLKSWEFDLGGGRGPNIHRKCQHCEEEEKLHLKENTSQPTEVNSDISSYISSLPSKGSSLPEETRNFFEPRFGYDFSNVKIHNDTDAAKSSQSINALAYTSGNNIVFNQNQFSPESDRGRKLLAHELTHVVQQNNLPGRNVQRDCADRSVKSSMWVSVKSEYDFMAVDGYTPLSGGRILDVFFDGKNYFFCYNDKKIYLKYGDNENGVIQDFEKMYGIKIEDGGDKWKPHELSIVSEALSMLSPAEISNLHGYRFIKEGGVRIDDGDKVTAGLTTQDIVHNDYMIQFWKFCFDGTSDTDVPHTAGISKGVSCVLHEIGHAMMFSRNRPLMEAMYFKDKYEKIYENASPEKQKKMKPKLHELIEAEDKADSVRSKKPTVDAEFAKLIKGKKSLTSYSDRNENEAFAEAFAIYKVNPDLLKKKNPKLYKYFADAGYQ